LGIKQQKKRSLKGGEIKMIALKLFLLSVEAFMRNPAPNRHFGKGILADLGRDGDTRLKVFAASYHHGLFFVRFISSQEPFSKNGWHAGLVSTIELTNTELLLTLHTDHGAQEFVLNLNELSEFHFQTIPRWQNKVFVIEKGKLVLQESLAQKPVHGGTYVDPSLNATNRSSV